MTPHRATLLLIAAATALRLAYLAWWCPYPLVEDEAHYWEWSRRLDWSYYSKGPGVAWLIAASTRLLGTSEFAVRLPAALSCALAAWAVARLAAVASRDPRAAPFAAACFLLAPAFVVAGTLMTIDMPYLACWALACLAGWHALERGSGPAWVALGLALAAGFLFKYTIALLPPGLALYAWLRARHHDPRIPRPRAAAGWIAAGAGAALLGLVPVLAWNAQRGWPTVRHLLGHLGLPGGDMPPPADPGPLYSPLWTLEYLGTQLGVIGPALGLAVTGALRAWHARRDDPGAWNARLFMLALAAPLLGFYLVVTFRAPAEGNWALGSAVTLLALAGMDAPRLLAGARAERSARRRRAPRFFWRATLLAGALVAVLGARADLAARLPGLGGLVPVGRLTVARPIAADAARLAGELRDRTGLEPFFVAQHYGRAAQLAFYLPGRPAVYCSSSRMGGRRTQYDYWPDTDLDDLSRLRGRPAVLVGGSKDQWAGAFEHVEELGPLAGEYKARRPAFLGFGYRGFAPVPSGR